MNLAAFGYRQIVESRALKPFFAIHDDGTACILVPDVQPDKVGLTIFYGALRRLSAKKLTDSTVEDLITNWRLHCRAFVSAELDLSRLPHLKCTGHDATRHAGIALDDAIYVPMPSLSEIDAALSTSLELHEVDQLGLATKFIVEATA